ncbi:transglycosylase family protein [Conexibacter sp. SYSU D00693]|uniref:transglycosylase family protein n=1 Tax=Conexibacter sp. SYSU D00693 TaxID=2812560 RepID=UPI0027389681|nr:transglycosylase family protein [Conexibacter sp. SYSU D00693]
MRRRTPTFLAATTAFGLMAATPPVLLAQASAQEDAPAAPAGPSAFDVHSPASFTSVAAEATDVVRDTYQRRTMRVARKLAAVQGRDLRDGYDDALRTFSTEDLVDQHREVRHDLRSFRRKLRRAAREGAGAGGGSIPGHLQAIAQCESGGDPAAVGGGGTYRGLFQFDQGTWQSVGGTGDPAAASVAEQVKRAQMLYARAGASPWPVCGS